MLKLDKKLFSLDSNAILYDGKEIKELNNILSKKFHIEKIIQAGANGITILVKHKLLDIRQVVKVYFDSKNYQKDLLESKKNASNIFRKHSLRVFDAGNFEFENKKLLYSIMEFGNGESISKWADRLANLYAEAKADEEKRNVIQIGINIIAAMVVAFSDYIKAGKTHGDLNPGNVMIYYNENTEEQIKKSILRAPAGTIEFDNLKVNLIDAGTSEEESTTKIIGIQRDAFFLIDNSRKILKCLMTKKDFYSLFCLCIDEENRLCLSNIKSETFVKEHLSTDVADSLLRFCAFSSILLGEQGVSTLSEDIENYKNININQPYYNEKRILLSIMFDESKKSSYFLENEIFPLGFISSWDTIHEFTTNSGILNWKKTMNIYKNLGFNYLEGYEIKREYQGDMNLIHR